MAGDKAADTGAATPLPAKQSQADQWVRLGRISGVFGVRGWVKVHSDTVPPDNILRYRRWHLERGDRWEARKLVDGRRHGKGIVARLDGCDDRDQAALLVGVNVAVPRDELPAAAEGEYYWADLEGLRVCTLDGLELGRIDHLFETGSNDVMVVKGDRERLLPFTDTVVCEVDLPNGLLIVDWDPGF